MTRAPIHTDIDTQHWQHQEAASLRRAGWTVVEPGTPVLPPERRNQCMGVGGPCLTLIPPGRMWCHYCKRTLRNGLRVVR